MQMHLTINPIATSAGTGRSLLGGVPGSASFTPTAASISTREKLREQLNNVATLKSFVGRGMNSAKKGGVAGVIKGGTVTAGGRKTLKGTGGILKREEERKKRVAGKGTSSTMCRVKN